jgi:hypothetical protein
MSTGKKKKMPFFTNFKKRGFSKTKKTNGRLRKNPY